MTALSPRLYEKARLLLQLPVIKVSFLFYGAAAIILGGLVVDILLENILLLEWKQVVMWLIGGLLIFLAIKKNMEPALLLPIGFGAILVNLPLSGVVTQVYDGVAEPGALDVLFDAGISNELFPCSCL